MKIAEKLRKWATGNGSNNPKLLSGAGIVLTAALAAGGMAVSQSAEASPVPDPYDGMYVATGFDVEAGVNHGSGNNTLRVCLTDKATIAEAKGTYSCKDHFFNNNRFLHGESRANLGTRTLNEVIAVLKDQKRLPSNASTKSYVGVRLTGHDFKLANGTSAPAVRVCLTQRAIQGNERQGCTTFAPGSVGQKMLEDAVQKYYQIRDIEGYDIKDRMDKPERHHESKSTRELRQKIKKGMNHNNW